MMKTMLQNPLFILTLFLCCVTGCKRQDQKAAVENASVSDLKMENIPLVVRDGLKAKFPEAVVEKWTEEREDGLFIYDIEFRQDGLKYEADIKADGSIHNWEKAIGIKDLPEIVIKGVDAAYPGCSIKEIMQITVVSEGMDVLEGYEILIETTDNKEIELTVATDGSIVEDSGDSRPEGK